MSHRNHNILIVFSILFQLDGVHVTSADHSRIFKLATTCANASESEELVFSIQGIITQRDLPPIIERSVTKSHMNHLLKKC